MPMKKRFATVCVVVAGVVGYGPAFAHLRRSIQAQNVTTLTATVTGFGGTLTR
jgi:hypothetical protein